MTYSVYGVDGTSQKITSQKTFDKVVLTDGKQFFSTVEVKNSSAVDIAAKNNALYVEGTDGQPEKKVLPDGKGTEVPYVPKPTDQIKFIDVPSDAWYYGAVEFVCEQKLMNGIGNNLFAPQSNLSRAQLAQILYNKEGKPAVIDNSSFTDVPVGQWYTRAVIWANKQGIVGGYGNGLFGPNDDITRVQLAVMLWRYAGKPSAVNSKLNFTDADKVSSWALDAIRWATEKGIVNGKGNGILDPGWKATRAETAQMLKNFLEK